jgi:hypothetical protein
LGAAAEKSFICNFFLCNFFYSGKSPALVSGIDGARLSMQSFTYASGARWRCWGVHALCQQFGAQGAFHFISCRVETDS